MAHRHDVAATREDVRLAELDFLVHELRGAQRHEDRVAVDFELAVAGVRSSASSIARSCRVNALLHGAQQFLVGSVQANPDEAAIAPRRDTPATDRPRPRRLPASVFDAVDD